MNYLGNNNQMVYGASQKPVTKEYVIVLKDEVCEKCNRNYHGYCKPCQINYSKENFTNWTSGNEKIDDYIKEMQLAINYSWDITVEWISYNRFANVKEIGKDDFATIYSAIWKDGPFNY